MYKIDSGMHFSSQVLNSSVVGSSRGERNWPTSNEGNTFPETLSAPVYTTASTGVTLILAKLNHTKKSTRLSIYYLNGYDKCDRKLKCQMRLAARYGRVQDLRRQGQWTLVSSRQRLVLNFTRDFRKVLARAGLDTPTQFHNLTRTALTNRLAQGRSAYDVMLLAGHASSDPTRRFYLVVRDNLVDDPFEVEGHLQSSQDSPTAVHSVLIVKKSDVTSPDYRHKVTINSTVWRVLKDESQGAVIKDDGYTWEIPIIRDERKSIR